MKPQKQWLSQEEIENHINNIDNFMLDMGYTDYDVEVLKGYRNIIVVGPQRSGTTFTAQVIAKDLGYEYIDEDVFRVRNEEAFKQLNQTTNRVFQAPALTYNIHNLIEEGDLVVFMVRKWSDILKSVNKKNKGKVSQYIYYKGSADVARLNEDKYISADSGYRDFFNNDVYEGDVYIWNLIYKAWKVYQTPRIENTLNIWYESMKKHEMWLDKPNRSHFGPKDIR